MKVIRIFQNKCIAYLKWLLKYSLHYQSFIIKYHIITQEINEARYHIIILYKTIQALYV